MLYNLLTFTKKHSLERKFNVMKNLIFVSNYINHHQLPLAQEFINIYGENFTFIAMTPFNQARLNIGYKDLNSLPFVLRAYESSEAMSQARRLIDESECIIAGGVPVNVISSRLKAGKLTFMQSERFFKGPFLRKDLGRFVKYLMYKGGRWAARSKSSKFYLLCESAFAAWDYNLCGLFRHKAYRWGYFPELKQYDDIDNLISRKKTASILWVGRFIDWKHPELAIKLAKNLRDSNINFSLKIIGSGKMLDELANMINALNLNDCVEIPAQGKGLPVDEVRREMENSQIFLFTSDRGEGWGAVTNEAMNSACAIIAGEKIGSVPYLIQDNHNGLIFRNKDINDLTRKVISLLQNPDRISELGRAAYHSINTLWNARTAAQRFIKLSEALRLSESNEPVNLYDDGPCSIAPVI